MLLVVGRESPVRGGVKNDVSNAMTGLMDLIVNKLISRALTAESSNNYPFLLNTLKDSLLSPPESNLEEIEKRKQEHLDFLKNLEQDKLVQANYERNGLSALMGAAPTSTPTPTPEALGLNPAETALLQSESGLRPTAQNPTSSAFGIGQMIKSNREYWGKLLGYDPNTTDPFKQVHMTREYIKKRYGTPENAWRFKQATMEKNPELAPSNLRDLANYWINKNYVGY